MDVPNLPGERNPFRYLWGLGYRRHCPIIPVDAPLHPDSAAWKRLQKGKDSRGKMPGQRGADGLWRGINFLEHEAAEADLDRWHAMGAGVGVLLGRGLAAVDIDTTDLASARTLYEQATRLLGPAPLRFGRRPKALLLYRTDEALPYSQVRFETPEEQDPQRPALVEILSEGRQFVAHGIHPIGTPYEWAVPLPPITDLPAVSRAAVDGFLEAVERGMPKARRKDGSTADRSAVDQAALRGDPELLRDAIKHLPNTPEIFPSRDEYVKVGIALKAALPDDEDLAFDLYAQWAGRWPAQDATPEEDWSRMHAPYGVGAGWLYELAEVHAGWTGRARTYFEPIHEEPALDLMPQARQGFEILSLDDLENLPDPRWLIARHVPQEGFGLLYGAPGCGKSFVVLDASLTLAYGLRDWHGDEIEARRGRVLYLAGEGSSGFKARVRAWRTGRLLPDVSPAFHLIRQPINFLRSSDIDLLIRTIREADLPDLDLVVVDTVSRSIPGADENLQKDMTLFVDAVAKVQDAFRCAALGVHHTSRQGNLRGSTVFEGQADFVFHLERQKGSSIGQLHCTKQKDGPDGWHDSYRFQEVGGSLVPVRFKAESEDEAPVRPDLEHGVLGAMQAAWDRNDPWAKRSYGRRRSAVGEMDRLFDIPKGEATAMLDRWTLLGKIEIATVDPRAKITGYRPTPAGWVSPFS